MPEITQIGQDLIEVAHREDIVMGLIVEAPTSETDTMHVVIPGFSNQLDYAIPAGNWTPRGTALPPPGANCVVCFDEDGEAWVPIWHGTSVFPSAGNVPIGTIIEYAGPSAPGNGSWLLADGSSQLRAGGFAALYAALTSAVGTATATLASPGVFTTPTAHGLSIGDCVTVSTTGALPTGMTAGVGYYVMTVPTGTTFTLGTTRTYNTAGAPTVTVAINTSGSQSGVHSVTYTPWGAADATHFNVPDLRGRSTMAPSASHRAGSSGGEESHTLLSGESGLPAHTHTEVAAGAHNHTPDVGGNFAVNAPSGNTADFVGGAAYTIRAVTNTAGSHTHTINNAGPTDAGAPHNTLHPFAAVPKWIRYA